MLVLACHINELFYTLSTDITFLDSDNVTFGDEGKKNNYVNYSTFFSWKVLAVCEAAERKAQ